ncbi:CmcI family methyltransferase [Asticcacaulis sp. SL142]|uniref:class I SAM-dependent methyltransferase n=1 Tax=Asticcacaulis sp. SL142 TaxID=2995155 RepID=UPI00226CB323|nr:CmcI family methyltransferase [Asticcacaulis sp. SL142]WAC47066.1 CmcI family methyltransferase [Asticcacaulis sp. SL142]
MTDTKKYWANAIWGKSDPYSDANQDLVDLQGWASDNIYLTHAIEELKPRLVVEIGVWKGGSVITMARRMKELGIDGAVIAIDTWLGASEHWIDEEWHASLRLQGGYPSLYKTFAANIVSQGLQNYVIPLPLDSINAGEVLKRKGLVADIIHIDGGHDLKSVTGDLEMWWPMLRQGGLLIGDDYHPYGETWPEVREGFHKFFEVDYIRNTGGKCVIMKPTIDPSIEM